MNKPFRLTERIKSEDELHREIASAMRILLPPCVMFFSIEHRNARSAVEGAMRKERGVQAGVPDCWFVHQGRCYAIELKSKDGRLSDNQVAFHARLTAAGLPVAVCRSLDEVIRKLSEWGVPTRVVA